MLMPKRVKHRKQFRGSMAGKATRGNKITNGEYGIVALEPCWIKSNQIEAARIAMTRYIKRGGKVWIKIFPDKPVTAQPAEGFKKTIGSLGLFLNAMHTLLKKPQRAIGAPPLWKPRLPCGIKARQGKY